MFSVSEMLETIDLQTSARGEAKREVTSSSEDKVDDGMYFPFFKCWKRSGFTGFTETPKSSKSLPI